MFKKITLCLGLVCLSTAVALQARALNIEIDGELDETAWQQGFTTDNFKITAPFSLETPPNETEAFVTSTEDGIYIGFINQQSLDESIESRSLRDAEINSDYNEVIIDFDAQSVRAFGFKVSRSGAIQDSIWSDENRESTDWDGEWHYAVEVDDDEWRSEIFIPWSIVSMLAGEAAYRDVKIYLSRWHQGRNMRFSYPGIDRSQKTFIGKFYQMRLAFKEQSSIDFFPYISYNRDIEFQSSDSRVGMDIFWKPSSAQQLNVTVKPDFGQVESDDLIVNFSAVETFFSEKRPFFRENHDLFDLQGPENLRLVHTPRIGGESDIEDAKTNEIKSAARYNYIGDQLDFGLLAAFEDGNSLSLGRDYFAARAQYKLEKGRLGVLRTSTKRPSLNRESIVNVLDFQFDPSDELKLIGQYFTAEIDLDATTTKDNGWWIGAEWEPSDEWSHELFIYNYGNDLDVSDFGFVERVNREQWTYEGTYLWTELDWALRDVELSWYLEDKKNTQNHDLPFAFSTTALFTFDSTRALEFEFELVDDGVDDLITRGNNPIFLPRSYKTNISYFSEQNSAFTYEISIAQGVEFLDGKIREFEFKPSFQINENTDLTLELEWEKGDSWLIWDEGNELEEFKRDELTLAINLNAVLAERHELRLKVESVALEARSVNEYSADPAGQLTINDEPPDSFSLSEFASQVRYRYEIGPLSELFVVYSRGGEFEEEGLAHDTLTLLNRSITRDDSENLLVKIKMHF